jgi:integron integrase
VRAVHETSPAGPPKPRLLDRVRVALRTRHYSRRTEEAYVAWIRRYILFHRKRHPAEMGAPEITRFLSSLAVELSALLFLYRAVLELDLPWLDGVVRAKRPQRLPVILTREEVRAVLQPLEGVSRLMAHLLYGAGLRLLECCRLRVQDVDFGRNQIVVRTGKGDKDRVTMLPEVLKADLARHLEGVREQHARDLQHGAGWVELPTALGRKYPNAGREWVWQWIFPATRLYVDPDTRQRRRHHLHESVLQRTVNGAVRRAGVTKRLRPTPSATPSRPISSRTATTSEPFKSSSDTEMWQPPRSTHTCSTEGRVQCEARLTGCSTPEAPGPAWPAGIGRRDRPRRAAAERRGPEPGITPQVIGRTRRLATGGDSPYP